MLFRSPAPPGFCSVLYHAPTWAIPHMPIQSCYSCFHSTQNLPKTSYFLDSPPFCSTPMPAPIFPVLIGEKEGPFQRPLLGGVGMGQEV